MMMMDMVITPDDSDDNNHDYDHDGNSDDDDDDGDDKAMKTVSDDKRKENLKGLLCFELVKPTVPSF